MKKAGRYTKIASCGKVKAEWHHGYINSYMDHKNNVPVEYFVYRNSKNAIWYAVDMETGMAIARAEKRNGLMRLDDKRAEQYYAMKNTDHYKELERQFKLLVGQEVKSMNYREFHHIDKRDQ